jgi:hypothetical protein
MGKWLWAEFGPQRPISSGKQARLGSEAGLDCGLILKKFEGYYRRFYVRGCGLPIDFGKVQGLFYKMTGKRPIWAIHPADPMAENGGRRGHVPWPRFGA